MRSGSPVRSGGVIFRFGDFELDEDRFELRRQGHPVSVQPKVLRLLLLLVAQRHRSISDDELMDALWPNETVGRPSIKRAVMGARIALDDRGQGSIRTIRGHGYQFMLPVRDATDAVSNDTGPSHVPVALPVTTSGAVHFVGREGVMTELEDSLQRIWEGSGHCVLVWGEPGMGKTRLLQELAKRASAMGARVWSGRCMEFDGAPPFWPLQQILQEALRGKSDHELRELLGEGASDIVSGFPELKHSVSDLPVLPKMGSVAARFRLFDSTARFLIRAAQEQPIVLLLDDLQRADQPTLRLLLFVAGQLDNSRLLLVGTARQQDQRDREAHERLAELARESATRSIVLSGFSQQEIARYIELRMGSSAPLSVVTRLSEQTAGNPLFLEEMLRSLRSDTRSSDASNQAWHSLSQVQQSLGLRGAIERHLATLPAPCRALLESAAVLGRDFSVGLLKQLIDGSPDTVVTHLSEATAAGILQALPTAVGQYRFTHALIRDVLYERCDALVRARRHARAGFALEARSAAFGDDAELAQMAEHFRLAAPTHDLGKGLHYARRAAERATQRLAYEEAAVHLGRALQLLELQEPDAVLRLELLIRRAEALEFSDVAASRATLLQAIALARALGSVDVLAQAGRLLGRTRETGMEDKVAIEVFRETLAALPTSDPRRPCLQAMLAKALTYQADVQERGELALSAVALARQLGDLRLRAEALMGGHEALSDPCYLPQRISIATELKELAHQHGDPRTMAYALTTQFQNSLECGDVAAMDMVLSSLQTLAQQVRDPLVHWYEKSYRSTRASIDGRYELAERCARDAFEYGEMVGFAAYHYYCAQVIGVMRLQGRLEEALVMTTDISSRYPALAGWRAFLGCLHADCGNFGVARQILTELMDDGLVKLRRDPYILSTLCPAAELCARVGDEKWSRLLYDALLPYEHLHGTVSIGAATYGPVSLYLASLAGRMNLLPLAEQHCAHALAAAERMPSTPFIVFACLTYAQTLKDVPSERKRTLAFLRRAEQLAEGIGMHTIANHARNFIQQLG